MRSLLRIHLLNIRDGSPHCGPLSNAITWAIPQDMPQIRDGELAITGSRVMLCLYHPSAALRPPMALVWDRTTGNLVKIL